MGVAITSSHNQFQGLLTSEIDIDDEIAGKTDETQGLNLGE